MDEVRGSLEQSQILIRNVLDVAVRFPKRAVSDVKVVTALDHAQKTLVMRAHARPPDRRRAGQAPFASCAVLLSNELLGADLALAVKSVGGVVGVIARDVADVAHQL